MFNNFNLILYIHNHSMLCKGSFGIGQEPEANEFTILANIENL
jgi:hypothetical protein